MTPARPTPFLQGSIGLHLFAAGLVTTEPRWWPMAAGAVVVDHLAIVGAGLWPRSTLLGPNLTRLGAPAVARREVALTIDDGPDPEVTPRVLDLLDAHGVRATFFCIGERVLQHAALARDLVRRGHALENHSHRHRHDFSLSGPGRLAREIGGAQRAIADTVGVAPRFFRAPAGLRNVFLQPVLAREGLALASWTRRGFDTVASDAERVVARLTKGLAAGDILLVHDGHAARSADDVPTIVVVLPKLVAALEAAELAPVTLVAAA